MPIKFCGISQADMKDAGTEDICQLLQAPGEDNCTAKESSLSFS